MLVRLLGPSKNVTMREKSLQSLSSHPATTVIGFLACQVRIYMCQAQLFVAKFDEGRFNVAGKLLFFLCHKLLIVIQTDSQTSGGGGGWVAMDSESTWQKWRLKSKLCLKCSLQVLFPSFLEKISSLKARLTESLSGRHKNVIKAYWGPHHDNQDQQRDQRDWQV